MACSISRQALACRLFAEHYGREHDASTMMRTGMIMRMVDTGCFCTDTGGHDRSWRQNFEYKRHLAGQTCPEGHEAGAAVPETQDVRQ